MIPLVQSLRDVVAGISSQMTSLDKELKKVKHPMADQLGTAAGKLRAAAIAAQQDGLFDQGDDAK